MFHSSPFTPHSIAIIGIGCRFPGGVFDADSFWRFLAEGGNAIREIPADRFPLDSFYAEQPATPGKVMTRWGGFLDNIDRFDAAFFEMSPREAERLDPAQRLLLETAWEALEDGGQVANRPALVNTGVFVGLWLSDFEARLFKDPAKVDFYMTTGSGRYSASGRLSYAFGFQGPSVTVDTACSSSLVAVHLACQSLRAGECRLALAGGANVILQPHITIAYSQSKMMAADGRCKFGDERADGYVRSEGAAVIAIKRLEDAIADGDPVYAVILGSAVNNDGRSSGFLTTPGGAGQEDMLRKAYANAGVSPGHVQYIEAHGTGTRAGDPVEIGALGTVLREGRPAGLGCTVGSVKTNFGHTEGAAGLAGLIKLALSLHHRALPASLHFQKPSPSIPWESLPLRIQSQLTPWPESAYPKIGGASAFGIAGTNAHVVLTEFDGLRMTTDRRPTTDERQRSAVILPLSAKSRDALAALAARHATALQSPISILDYCHSAAVRRTHHEYRLAIVGGSADEMRAQLETLSGDEFRAAAALGEAAPRKVAFVFPGQGSQWVGMGRQLYAGEPVFRAAIERCAAAFAPLTDWALVEMLHADEHPRQNDIDVVQPMLFAVQAALAEQWRAWGVEPQAVIGHSMGEAAAAYIAGALSLEDAARVICRRSQLMIRVAGRGAMAVVDLTRPQAEAAIAGLEDRLGIAVSNSPRSTVLSGDTAALAEVTARLQAQNIFCRQVKVDVAAHSPHMDALRPELLGALEGLTARSAAIKLFSTVTGQLHDGAAFDREYWGMNLRQPVLFSDAVLQALVDGVNTFIEISPHPILLQPIEQTIQTRSTDLLITDYCSLPSLRRGEPELPTLLRSLGDLYTAGYPLDWSHLYPAGQVVRLPAYPWQRETYWLDAARDASASFAAAPIVADDPALDEWMYVPTWVDVKGAKEAKNAKVSGSWLVLGSGDLAEALVNVIARRAPTRQPAQSEAMGSNLPVSDEIASQKLLAMTGYDEFSAGNIVFLAEDGQSAEALVEVIAALARNPAPHKLWLVTRGARPVSGGPDEAALDQSLLWGIGLVAAEEHPDFWAGCIDLDLALSPETAAETLLPELLAPDSEPQIALYAGSRFVARLARLAKAEQPAAAFHWRPDAAYLITGGMGAIGLQLAQRLAGEGARRIILIGRTPLPPRGEWADLPAESAAGQKVAAIRRIEALGACVHLAFVDVTDEAQVTAFIEQYRREGWPPVRGIFHTAGITRDRLLAQMTADDLAAVLRPKVTGGFLLHKHFPELDFFVLFSSIGAVLGQVGQGSYAAANAYLDALAHHRRAHGLPALAVNWGAWAGMGLLTTTGGQVVADNLNQQGLHSFTAEEGLNALNRLLRRSDAPPQVSVFPADWAQFAAQRKSQASARFTSEFSAAAAPARPAADLPAELAALEARPRRARLEAYIQQQVAQVLKLSAARVLPHKPLGTLGLDSLMTIELRNRLEAGLGVSLPATLVWNYPTIHEMAPFLASRMGLALTEAGSPPAESAPPAAAPSAEAAADLGLVITDISALSDEEALKELLRKT